ARSSTRRLHTNSSRSPPPTWLERCKLDAKFHQMKIGFVDGFVAAVAERRRVLGVLTVDRRDFGSVPRSARADVAALNPQSHPPRVPRGHENRADLMH